MRSLSNVTCGAKLDDFTPLWNDVIAIDLLGGRLHCYRVLCPGAQEPVPAHCHGQRDSLGHQLGGYILTETKGASDTQITSETKPICTLFFTAFAVWSPTTGSSLQTRVTSQFVGAPKPTVAEDGVRSVLRDMGITCMCELFVSSDCRVILLYIAQIYNLD